jgi:DNA-binding NtrC family response regulator
MHTSNEYSHWSEDLGSFPHMAKKSSALRVLVVDDEVLIRWSLSEALTTSGHTVVEAGDGASALQALQDSWPIDVVLLDFRLPDSNDLGLLSNIRRLSPETSVILMSAYGTPEVTRGALDIGAWRVLSKPFDMHDVPALVVSAHDAGEP